MTRSTELKFRKNTIKYLNEHWIEIVDSVDIANSLGYVPRYFERKFKEYFGVSFSRYLTQYKLHRAAEEIRKEKCLNNIGKMVGFSNAQSFSKAFKKEFGMSPRQFLYSENEVPDMPAYYAVDGKPIEIVYQEIEGFEFYAVPVLWDKKEEIDYVEDRGYLFENPHDGVDIDVSKEEKIGMWWHDEKHRMSCLFGPSADTAQEMQEGMCRIEVPRDLYAVISVSNYATGGQTDHVAAIIRQISYFAYYEWAVVNRKNLKQFGVTFEKYSRNKISFYIPIQRNIYELNGQESEEGPEAWTRYIDKHLLEKPKTVDIAAHFNYSLSHFIYTFSMYYNMPPRDYIRKRKLYLTAHEIKQNEANIKEIVKKYGFSTVYVFRRSFFREFGVMPEDYKGNEYILENISLYYSLHRHNLKISFVQIDDIYMTGENVIPEDLRRRQYADVIECISFQLKKNRKQERGQKGEPEMAETQVVVWQNIHKTGRNVCLSGWESLKDSPVKKGLSKVKIQGGFFAVLETEQDSDEEHLIDAYRLLYRCAFAGWIKENRARIDFTRLTFVRYRNGKLYFYIPLNE